MVKISLTDFVDFVSFSGTPKATKVRSIKNRGPYNPATDYYKQLREGIIETHENNKPKKAILEIQTHNDKKASNYAAITNSYHSWWGKKKLSWFKPTHGSYGKNNVKVNVNPELGVVINGTPHLIKLYFKKDKISKNKADIITNLMDKVLKEHVPSGTKMSVLDIKRKKLFAKNCDVIDFDNLLDAELAYMSSYLSH